MVDLWLNKVTNNSVLYSFCLPFRVLTFFTLSVCVVIHVVSCDLNCLHGDTVCDVIRWSPIVMSHFIIISVIAMVTVIPMVNDYDVTLDFELTIV